MRNLIMLLNKVTAKNSVTATEGWHLPFHLA